MWLCGALKFSVSFTGDYDISTKCLTNSPIGEHACKGAISIEIRSKFIDITLSRRCSPQNLMYGLANNPSEENHSMTTSDCKFLAFCRIHN